MFIYISLAGGQPFVAMLLYQSHAECLVRLFSEPVGISQTVHLPHPPHDKCLVSQSSGKRLWGIDHGFFYADQQ